MFKKTAVLLTFAVFLVGCSHAAKTTNTPGSFSPKPSVTTGKSVEIKNFAFSPPKFTVKAGETIAVCNRDLPGHTMTSDDGKSFNSGLLGKDQCGTIIAPQTPGEYPYHCTPHPNMKAVLVVE